MHTLNFLTHEQVWYIKSHYKLPLYVYSEEKICEAVAEFKAFPSAFWCDVRFAMKANSNGTILKILKEHGLKIDASSEYEVYRAIHAGFKGEDIQVSWQELSEDFGILLDTGVFFVATSLYQLEAFGKMRKWGNVGVRINPWVGSWAFQAISTGGVNSSFGIWHEYIPQIQEIAEKYDLHITKIHLHIGSENTPESWVHTANMWLEFVKLFPEVDLLDLGGGFKKAIMPYEKTIDLVRVGEAVKKKVEDFYAETGRKIKLEIEPWKYLVINACSVLCKVVDIVDTGKDGYTFVRTNSGMTEMPRVSMYWVQQPIIAINDSQDTQKYVVVGHCCESGDILTCKLYDSETLETILLPKLSIGDVLVVEGTGAYNSSMSMKNYNSYPEVAEVMVMKDWEIREIRRREKVEEIWRNEV